MSTVFERKPDVFPYDNFIAEFPEFDSDSFTRAQITRLGQQAGKYIKRTDKMCFPLSDPSDRQYALFLMTAHMLLLRKNAINEMNGGGTPTGGRVRKATVGAVIVETDSPNSWTMDDFTYWLSQTSYGQELLAYLENSASAGIYCNCRRDSVRLL